MTDEPTHEFDLGAGISAAFRVHQRDGHTHFTVYAGRTPGSRGNAGRLVLTDEEFDALTGTLRDAEMARAHYLESGL